MYISQEPKSIDKKENVRKISRKTLRNKEKQYGATFTLKIAHQIVKLNH